MKQHFIHCFFLALVSFAILACTDSGNAPRQDDTIAPPDMPEGCGADGFDYGDEFCTGLNYEIGTGYSFTDHNEGEPDSFVDGDIVEVEAGETNSPNDEEAARAIQEADLFRVIGNYIYILNRYKGLAIIEVLPDGVLDLLGRLPLEGFPKDMYVDNGIAMILLTGLYEHETSDDEISATSMSKLVAVDIANPFEPERLVGFKMEGEIIDSRQVGDIIYAVSAVKPAIDWCYDHGYDYGYGYENDNPYKTEILAVDISDPDSIHYADRHSLEGDSLSIYVTNQAMYVAERFERSQSELGSEITYLDISDPNGAIVERDSFMAHGWVPDRFKMYQNGDVFVAVTIDTWDAAQSGTTFLQTFNVADPEEITPLSEPLHIISGERLHASRFRGNRAYIVTFEVRINTDPLFVVDFSNPEAPETLGELIIPGWSTHMEIRGTKILAVGLENGLTKVSLFDVEDPTNPTELSKLALDDRSTGVSEAVQDWRAFKVYDDLGMILVPSVGWDSESHANAHRLHLVDFTEDTLTKRGNISSESKVLRGFLAGDYLGSLSESGMQLIDFSDRDAPFVTSEIEFAGEVSGLWRCKDSLCSMKTKINRYWNDGQFQILAFDQDEPEMLTWTSDSDYAYFDLGATTDFWLENENKSKGYFFTPVSPYIFNEEGEREYDTLQYGLWNVYRYDLAGETFTPEAEGILGDKNDTRYHRYGWHREAEAALFSDKFLALYNNHAYYASYDGYLEKLHRIEFFDIEDLSAIEDLGSLRLDTPLISGLTNKMIVTEDRFWLTDCRAMTNDKDLALDQEESIPFHHCDALEFDMSDRSNLDDVSNARRINIPGQLVGVDEAQSRFYTINNQYGEGIDYNDDDWDYNFYYRDKSYPCLFSLEILEHNGESARRLIEPIPLSRTDECVFINNYRFSRKKARTSGKKLNRENAPRSYYRTVDFAVHNGEDFFLVAAGEYTLSQFWDYDEDICSTATPFRVVAKIIDKASLTLEKEITIHGYQFVFPVEGGGILALGQTRPNRFGKTEHHFAFITPQGELKELEESYQLDGEYAYSPYLRKRFQPVYEDGTLYLPLGMKGIKKIAIE